MPRTLFQRLRIWLSGNARDHEDLLESEARYRELVEDTPDAIFIHVDERIVYANRAALALLGATAADRVVGRLRRDFIHPDDRAASATPVEGTHAGLGTPRVNQRYVRLDGSVVLGEVVAARVDYRGRPATLLFVRGSHGDLEAVFSGITRSREDDIFSRMLHFQN